MSSDIEEPPSKMSKYEEYLEEEFEESMEDGQEEWLSEGVLTDDDYNPALEAANESSTNTSQEDHGTEVLQETDTVDHLPTDVVMKTGPNIEAQLNSLDGTKNIDDLPDDLDAFLIRKTDGKVVEAKIKEEPAIIKAIETRDEDDGNDTDDLLRMLGEGENKAKKTVKVVKTVKDADMGSSDDDEFVYERSKVKTLKLAKNALIKRKPAKKAEPEDMSDGDDETEQSSDDVSTVQRMFEVRKVRSMPTKSEAPKRVVKHVVRLNTSGNKNAKTPEPKINKPQTKQPNSNQKSVLKSVPPKPPSKPVEVKSTPSKPPSKPVEVKSVPPKTVTPKPPPKPVEVLKSAPPKPAVPKTPAKSVEVKTPAPFRPLNKSTSKLNKESKSEVNNSTTSKQDDFDEIIDGEEFLEEDDIDLDEEEFGEESEGEMFKQRIMRPERMDEEVPSDADSHSEDGSLYDELPSSDSDDLEDWFTLDIRAERAGDYLPLLGAKARELLLAERRRVSARVATLRQSLSALTGSARRQADQLRAAAMALAEVDDTLRSA